MACSDISSGTELYMSLYPKDSTDGVVRLGNIVPDFSCETTQGYWKSFHQWKGNKWAVLFSHPADFTPVCTTEIASLQNKYRTLQEMDCLVVTLSVDPVTAHKKWLQDVIAQSEDEPITSIDFPIIADENRDISTAYGMIDPWTSDRQQLPLTIRCVFIINPEHKLMLSLNYPACVGRNMTEIVRCVQALQLSYQKSVATPANWPNNHKKVTLANGTTTTQYEGGVFLLPTVTKQEADQHYPGYHTCIVPSAIPYLRLVQATDVGQLPVDNPDNVESCWSKAPDEIKRKQKLGVFAWFRGATGSNNGGGSTSTSGTKGTKTMSKSNFAKPTTTTTLSPVVVVVNNKTPTSPNKPPKPPMNPSFSPTTSNVSSSRSANNNTPTRSSKSKNSGSKNNNAVGHHHHRHSSSSASSVSSSSASPEMAQVVAKNEIQQYKSDRETLI